MPHSFHRSMALLIPEKKIILFIQMFSNTFPHLPLKKISMILQMKLAANGFFVVFILGMASGKVIYGTKFNLKNRMGRGADRRAGETFEVIGPFSSNMQAHFYNSGRKTLDQYKSFRFY